VRNRKTAGGVRGLIGVERRRVGREREKRSFPSPRGPFYRQRRRAVGWGTLARPTHHWRQRGPAGMVMCAMGHEDPEQGAPREATKWGHGRLNC
jgi:hypothetical protein